MAGIQFQGLSGTFTVMVLDNDGAPSSVLEASKEFYIDANWTLNPPAAGQLGGQWEVAAYVESIGQGPEQQVGPVEVRALNGGTTYSARITVPAGTLPNNPAPPLSGVYKLVTVLIHRNFGTVTDLAAVEEGPILRIG